MNTRLRSRNQIVRNMHSKAYRDAFVETHIRNGIAFQIRAMRALKKWKQQDLAEKIDTKQEAICRLENPDYGRFTLETLRRLASVFDVALIVRFAPFSELINRANYLTPNDISVPDFAHDDGLTDFKGVSNVLSLFPAPSSVEANAGISLATDVNQTISKVEVYG